MGKRDKPNVARFEANQEHEIFQLQKELVEGFYQPGEYRAFQIFEPKTRLISAAPFRDRVVHHAICIVVEPIFEQTFIHDSYANRKGKGTHLGIHRCRQYLHKHEFVLKSDIQKYFPSVDHAILKQLIARKISCPQTLDLVFKIIDNSNQQEFVPEYFPGDDLFSLLDRRKRGNFSWAARVQNPPKTKKREHTPIPKAAKTKACRIPGRATSPG